MGLRDTYQMWFNDNYVFFLLRELPDCKQGSSIVYCQPSLSQNHPRRTVLVYNKNLIFKNSLRIMGGPKGWLIEWVQ